MALNKVASLSDRLKEGLSDDITVTELANKIGMSKQAISTYVTGIRVPNRPVINAISEVLNINPMWLMGYDVKKTMHINPKKVNVPISDDLCSDGLGNIVGQEEIPVEWTNGGQKYVGIKLLGDSMYPKYLDGDILIIKLQNDCESGQDAIISVDNGMITVRTVIKLNKDEFKLLPANPEYQPKTMEAQRVNILGVIKRLKRDF